MSTDSDNLRKEWYSSKFGQGLLVWRDVALVSHCLPSQERITASAAAIADTHANREQEPRAPKSELASLLEDYFCGRRVFFPREIPLERSNWSSFGDRVADALAEIPYGETVSYQELAKLAGHPRAQRAAGSFLAGNPFPVILPCHRVIRSDGSAGFFSAGAVWKLRLLKIEGIYAK